MCTGFSRFRKQSSERRHENCHELTVCVTAEGYLEVKGARLFYGDVTPDGFYAEQDRVAGCCEQLNETFNFHERKASQGLCFVKLVLHVVITVFAGLHCTLLEGGIL